MLAHIYMIVSVPVVQQSPGYRGGRVLAVGQYAYLGRTLYQCAVQFGPRTPRQRHDAHVVVGHDQPMGQQLQRVEGGIERYLSLGHLAADGVGNAEEQRVAAGEDDDGGRQYVVRVGKDGPVLFEHLVQRHRDVYPLRALGQLVGHHLVMARTAAERPCPGELNPYLWREAGLRPVCYSDNYELHCCLVVSEACFTSLFLVSTVRRRRR